MNYRIVKKNNDANTDNIKLVASQLNLNERLVEILFSRGLTDVDSINKYLNPDVKNLYDPYLMKGMSEAVDRIKSAIANNEKVVVYGDYDADGVCAASILSLYLASQGLDVFTHIPNRMGEGYGLNVNSLGVIIENTFPDLIITCDCGISSCEEVDFVHDLGVDIIITDHHECGERIPNCVVINPKQNDCNYPYNMLCGAGVALKLVQALGGIEATEDYFDFACVATIADLVPLLDENRLIVQLGLNKLKNTNNIGLRELFNSLGVVTPTSSEIAYKIAPRINAAGRMGDAYRAFEMLTSSNLARVKEIIKEINEDNSKRKVLCDEMYKEAVEDLAYEDMVNNRAIVLSHPTWEKGITGIVAARLTNDYNRPTFIIVNSDKNVYKGTCRSISNISVFDILSNCSELLIEFGGHNQAAGFSIEEKNIPLFKQKVNEYLMKYPDSAYLPTITYDIDLSEKEITKELVNAFELIEPIGNCNLKPLIRVVLDGLSIAPCKNNSNHISITTPNGLQIFAFSYVKQSYQLLGSGEKEVILEIQPGLYGNKQPKGVLKACNTKNLYVNKSNISAYAYDLLLYKAKCVANYELLDEKKLNDIVDKNLYGTLYIASTYEEYDSFIKKYNYIFDEYIYSSNSNNYSKVIIAPDFSDETLSLSLYSKVVFLSRPLFDGVISYINSRSKAKIFVYNKPTKCCAVLTTREVMAKYYDVIRQVNGVEKSSLFSLFKNLNSTMSDINAPQLAFCIAVFEELAILQVQRNPYKLKIIPGKKVDLNTSEICKKVNRNY